MTDSTNPFESLTAMMAMSVMLHEMFQSFIDAGFTREEGMQLIQTVITSMAGGASDGV